MRHHPIALEVTTGLRADGTIVGRQARMTLDTGAYCGQGPFIAEIATFVAAGPYRIPHLDIGLVSPGPSRAATTPSAGRA
ncbi:molybdopterin-dependent oxidoreductase [Streptomyces sp. NBC_00144]|uniref:molybdopterin cofactor-binding domain-containing protein n=1 Tax=Streptomyces sp. NBC_00144 TaxID=2975665 RepID=UPI00325293CC